MIILKVLIARPRENTRIDISEWERLAEVEYLETQDEETLKKQIEDVHVLIAGRVPITAGVLDAEKRLKLIQVFSVTRALQYRGIQRGVGDRVGVGSHLGSVSTNSRCRSIDACGEVGAFYAAEL